MNKECLDKMGMPLPLVLHKWKWFANACAFNDLVIGGSIFLHKATHRATCLIADHQPNWPESGGEALWMWESKEGADLASDRYLLLWTFKVKLWAHRDHTTNTGNIQNLKSKEIAGTLSCSVKNRYSALQFVEDVHSHWTALKHIWQESCDEVLGKRKRNPKEWLSLETWNLITQRKCFKVKIRRRLVLTSWRKVAFENAPTEIWFSAPNTNISIFQVHYVFQEITYNEHHQQIES